MNLSLETVERRYQAKCDEVRRLRAAMKSFIEKVEAIQTPRERAALKPQAGR